MLRYADLEDSSWLGPFKVSQGGPKTGECKEWREDEVLMQIRPVVISSATRTDFSNAFVSFAKHSRLNSKSISSL